MFRPAAQKATVNLQAVMINLEVDDLDGVLDRLMDEDVTVDSERESYDFRKVWRVHRPKGNSRRALAARRN